MSRSKGREVLETFPVTPQGSLDCEEARFKYAAMIKEAGAQNRMGVSVHKIINEVGNPMYAVCYSYYTDAAPPNK